MVGRTTMTRRNPMYERLALVLSIAFAVRAVNADTYWTGGAASGSKDWTDAGNWYSSGGNRVFGGGQWGRLDETHTEVEFSSFVTNTTGVWIENGSKPGIIWDVERYASDECGLAITWATKNSLNIGTALRDGSLAVNGGTYHIANELWIANGSTNSTFRMNGGLFTVGSYVCIGYGNSLCSGSMAMNGGVFRNTGGAFIVGQSANAGSKGFFGMNYGTVDIAGDVYIAERAGSGQLLVYNGSFSFGGTMYAGRGANTTAEIGLSKGEIVSGGDFILGRAAGSTATMTVWGGDLRIASGRAIRIADGNGARGRLTVNGGTVHADSVILNSSAGLSEFIVNGGALAPSSSTTSWLSGSAVRVGTSGMKIDTCGLDATFSASLVEIDANAGVGILKLGEGDVSFSNAAISGLDRIVVSNGGFRVARNSTLPCAVAVGGEGRLVVMSTGITSSGTYKLLTVGGVVEGAEWAPKSVVLADASGLEVSEASVNSSMELMAVVRTAEAEEVEPTEPFNPADGVDLAGTGEILVTNLDWHVTSSSLLAAFNGTIVVGVGGRLYDDAELHAEWNHPPYFGLGEGTKIRMEGGEIARFGTRGGANNEHIGSVEVKACTTNVWRNTESRSGAGGCHVNVRGAVTGGGRLEVQSRLRNVMFYDDLAGFTGELALEGVAFEFKAGIKGGTVDVAPGAVLVNTSLELDNATLNLRNANDALALSVSSTALLGCTSGTYVKGVSFARGSRVGFLDEGALSDTAAEYEGLESATPITGELPEIGQGKSAAGMWIPFVRTNQPSNPGGSTTYSLCARFRPAGGAILLQ